MLGRALRGTGELCITAGVVVLLFVVYLLYWTDVQNASEQSHLSSVLAQQWAAPAPVPSTVAPGTTATHPATYTPPALGSAVGRIYIRRFGKNWTRVMVEGTSTADLDNGPGHVQGSAEAGAVGNFAVSGHRTTHGEPFNRLAELRDGDHVVVETRSTWVTYRVVGETVVDPSDYVVVTDQTPAIGTQGTAKRIVTFTTCNPEYSAAQRLIMRGVWVSTDAKRPGFVPAALQPGAV